MTQEIRISVIEIDEADGLVKYKMALSNETTSSSLEFYGYLDAFKVFAKDLLVFPKTIKDVVKFEAGKNDETWAYYLLLNVFCYQMNGHIAIQIVIDNHQNSTDTNKAEFYIKTVPASINQWGKLLNNWNPKIDKELVWQEIY